MTFGGVKPNPTLAHAEEGVRKATEFGADYILGVGGGSVIDSAKAIAHGTSHPDANLWDIWFKIFSRGFRVGCSFFFIQLSKTREPGVKPVHIGDKLLYEGTV